MLGIIDCCIFKEIEKVKLNSMFSLCCSLQMRSVNDMFHAVFKEREKFASTFFGVMTVLPVCAGGQRPLSMLKLDCMLTAETIDSKLTCKQFDNIFKSFVK